MKFGERKTTLFEEMLLISNDEIKKMKRIICVLVVLILILLTAIAYLGYDLYLSKNPDAKLDAVQKMLYTNHYMSYHMGNDTVHKDGRKEQELEEQL